MKQYVVLLLSFLSGVYLNAQVGIGNTNPQAVLDIAASNVASPTNTDGVLVPRVDDFPLTNPTASQDGMLIFITGNDTPTKGFYYWDQNTTTWIGINSGSKNTLDQAYDQGGLGVGATINATDGALRVDGDDGFLVTGTFGNGNTIDSEATNTGTRLFFNPNKAALRAGYVSGAQWNNSNIGDYSVALGESNSATQRGSFAAGSFTIASGRYACTLGRATEAPSYAELAVGSYPTTYTPANPNTLDLADRAFVIGNSTFSTSRSNAFEIWKDGRVVINEAYTLPTADGTINQVLTTDGSGGVTWATPTGSVTANNGLTETSGNVRLGGTLTQNTSVVHGNRSLSFNLNSLGSFNIQDSGSTFFEATNAGTVNVGRNFTYAAGDILNVYGGVSTSGRYVANFENTLTSSTSNGVSIRLAASNVSSNSYYIGFYRLGGTVNSGRIAGAGTGVMYVTTSDRRLKNSITDISNSLDIIDNIRPRLYEYNELPGEKEYGFIAQELQLVYPQAVSGNPNDDVKTNPMMVDYGRLTPLLTAGVKELHSKLETQQLEIKTLKEEIQALKSLLSKVNTYISAINQKEL